MSLWYFFRGSLVVVALGVLVHLNAPLPIAPLPVRTSGVPLPSGNVFRLNLRSLSSVDQPNPEGLAVDHLQRLYSGAEDGWIYQTAVTGDNVLTKQWVHTGGYPIGMAFAPSSSLLWVANYPLGLQSVSAQGEVATVVKQFEGLTIGFADDVVVSRDNVVYFTDASRRFNPLTANESEPFILWEILEGRANGRVLAYHPDRGETTVVVDAAYFPSGIALTLDESALLFVEISLNRIMRHWLSGPHAGKTEVFSDKLPGIPDDIFVQDNGQIWVTLVAPRDDLLDQWIQPYPWIKKLLVRLPNTWLLPMQYPQPGGSLLLLDRDGRSRCQFNLEPATTPANIVFGAQHLFVGTLLGRAPGHVPLSSLNVCEKSINEATL